MQELLRRIKVLAMDVDGTLTDGKIIVDSNGIECKNFDVQDGFGIVCARKAGLKTAVLSARVSGPTDRRCQDLQIDRVFNGVYPKTSAFEQMLKDFEVTQEEVCFVGDDLTDLVVLKRSGFKVAVANAVVELKQAADYVTTRKGGEGAVREAIELILKAQGKWGPELYEH